MPVLTKINTNVIADDAVTSAKIPADAVIASDIAAGAVGISELATVTGATAEYHKVPVYADDAARNTAIPSPANGMIIFNTTAGALQQYNGAWAAISPAPNVTSVSGFLNDDTDSTLTIFGSNFSSSSTVKMFTASAGGTQIGSNATTTFNSNVKLTAVFGAGSIGASGSTAYIEVDNAGVTNRFATAITVNADPVIALSGNTGTGADTTDHLGTYGGASAGGPTDSNTVLLLNFDKGGGRDFEDSSNIGSNGANITYDGGIFIETSPFGDGKTAMKFNGVDGTQLKITSVPSDDQFGDGDFTLELWVRTDDFNADSGDGLLVDHRNASNNNGFSMQIRKADGYLNLNDNTVNIFAFGTGNFRIRENTWHHLAIVRISNVCYAYIDGILSAPPAASTQNFISDQWCWGKYQGGNSYNFLGYLDEIRHVVGVGVYTGNFTVPTSRLATTQSAGAAGSNIAAITGTQCRLLIHSNLSSTSTSFDDSSATDHTVASTAVIHSTLYNDGVAESTVLAPSMPWPASGKKWGS